MKNPVPQIIVFILVLFLLSCTPIESPSSAPFSSDDVFKEFVGEYPLQDIFGSSYNLSIKSDKTFYFKAFLDSGGNWEQGGTVEIRDGDLHLIVNSERYPLVPNVLTPVIWGTRKYLIESEKIEDFCKSIKKGDEPRNDNYGYFFIKDGDWNIVVTGKPTSPNGESICI